MKRNRLIASAITGGVLLTIALGGCNLMVSGKPIAAITAPPSGTQADINSEVQVQVTATDAEGITRVDLLINGVVVASERSPNQQAQPLFVALLRWTPKAPGNQIVEVRAHNRKGDVSEPASISLQVRDVQALATGTPEPSPTPTTTATPTSTNTPPPTSPPAITVVLPPPPPPPPPPQPTAPTGPARPTNFTATGTGTTLAFTWTDNSINETGFRIYQVGEVPPIITLGPHAATGGMAHNWTGRPCNFSATFYIRAYNDSGESASSNSANAVTIPCQPEIFQATGVGGNIDFTWNDKATNESGFNIYQQGVSAPVLTRPSNSGQGAVNYSWTGRPCNIFATYFVRAFNSAGESLSSNVNGAVTIPCPPSGLKITNITKFLVEFQFTDNATNETGFRVYRGSLVIASLSSRLGSGSTVSGAQGHNCSFNFDVTHVYSVRAYNEAGESLTSEHVGATIPRC